ADLARLSRKRPNQAMNRTWQSFRAIWRYQGPGHAVLRASRKLLKPLIDWDVFYVFERDLSDSPSEYLDPEGISISYFKGRQDLLKAQSDLGPFCEHVETRLSRGDIAVVAYAGDGVAGYTWLSPSNIWVDEVDMMAIVRKGEIVHYDSFVRPIWRGHGLSTCLLAAARHYARLEGCDRTLSWISALNVQSLKTAQRLRPFIFEKRMIILSIKTAGMRRRKNFAVRGSLAGRFVHADPPLRATTALPKP